LGEAMIELHRKFGFRPRTAVWELTLRCNLSCRHCGSRAGRKRQDELSLAEALRLCDELGALGCRRLTLGGGEPLLRPDWPLIAERLRERGVTVGMVTNGAAWSEKVLGTVRAIGLESVAFSLDGLEESHDYLRASPGLWRRILGWMKRCREAGLNVSAVTTIYRRNVAELERLREVLRDHGVERWQVQIGTPTGNLADHPELVIEPATLLALVPRIASWCRDGRRPRLYPGHNVGYFGEPEESLRDPRDVVPCWTGCTAGLSVVGIESDGGIKGCLSLPSSRNDETAFLEGNVREQPLAEIWSRPGAFAYNRGFTVAQLGGFCRSCDYGEICRGGCTWGVFANNRFVRDNPYCYYRQLAQAGGAQAARSPAVGSREP
jgi:radical SAM protein with 4Fe4S-binding SPASM domain